MDKLILGVDIGGSHISSVLINAKEGRVLEETMCKREVNSQSEDVDVIFRAWASTIKSSLLQLNNHALQGIGIAMPGPFNYDKGISLIKGVNKYDALYGINLKEVFRNYLNTEQDYPVIFENDAFCFGMGESKSGVAKDFNNVISLTLGTGLGSCFIKNNKAVRKGACVPEGGCLYNSPFKDGIAEDYISSNWIVKTYAKKTGKTLTVKQIAKQATFSQDDVALTIFNTFGKHVAELLHFWIQSFNANCIVIGGGISESSDLFLTAISELLQKNWNINIPIKISRNTEISVLKGVLGLFESDTSPVHQSEIDWRKTSQKLLPSTTNKIKFFSKEYDLYPFTNLGAGKILSGYETLSNWILNHKAVIIDGNNGNDWDTIRENLARCFRKIQKNVLWYEMSAFLKAESEIDRLVRPFLGEPHSPWGKKTTLKLEEFYETEVTMHLANEFASFDTVILLGTGAGLTNWDAPILYVDLPKNEIQYRMRAGAKVNIGSTAIQENSHAYKRLYFVDWVILKEYRKRINDRIYVIADGQWKDSISWSFKSSINEGLDSLSQSPIRVRPWFEAGVWGGQWLKEHIPALNKNEVNYAWSFELISPENGIIFESDQNLLEISFDWLMERKSHEILGKDSAQFGEEFPIRFDFLDTFDGGNLSIQCHPSLSYIKEHFGETITQDETYYILDSKEGSSVYLGFQDSINPEIFREVLEESQETKTPINIENFVQRHPSQKHDLFLIPNRTIHSSGSNNLVLEISATPYIFTFKMYDWLRLDLDGRPRPINIEHAFNNLDFNRKGRVVTEELISTPRVLEATDHYQLTHLPTHHDHFYDIHRIELIDETTISCDNGCHVLMLVEGHSIVVKTINGAQRRFNYAETFIIPAAAGSFQLINESGKLAKVINVFIK